MAKYIYTIIISSLITGCVESLPNVNVRPYDIEAAIDNRKSFDLSSISASINFISLNAGSQDVYIGDIRKLEESRTRFYVMDQEKSPVKLFDRMGNFIAPRGQIGRGPNEFLFLSDIAIDYETDNSYMYVSDGGAMYLLAYDPTGKPVARFSLGLTGSDGLVFHDDKIILHRTSPTNYIMNPRNNSTVGSKVPLLDLFSFDLQSEGTVHVADKGSGNRIIMTKPSKPSEIGFIGGINSTGILSNNGKNLMVKEERNDTVFYYKRGELVTACVLDFGKYTFPAEAFGLNPVVSPGDSYLALDVFEGERFFFVVAHGQKDNTVVQLVFDRRNPTQGFSAIGPDGKQGLYVDGVNFKPCYVRDNRLVGYMQALDIVDNAATITNSDLKALAATLKEDSNPVIVVATLKK